MAGGRPHAKAATVGKGIAKGMAGFMDFKKSFEDAMRQNQWKKEYQAEQGRLTRSGQMIASGYTPENPQQYIQSGQMGNATRPPTPEGYIQLPDGRYVKNPNIQSVDDMTVWKQAQKEVVIQMGGSSWVAIDKKKQQQLYPAIEARFKELQKKFGQGGTSSVVPQLNDDEDDLSNINY